MHDIPLEFTHAAHKPLKEHFKDAVRTFLASCDFTNNHMQVEWMVHNKVNPGFARYDDVYKQAFRKLNYEYETLAKSKFSSTQWTNDFTKALQARPVMVERSLNEGEGFGPDGIPKCDACNHRVSIMKSSLFHKLTSPEKHIPLVAISFNGKAYVKETLEEIDNSDDEDEEEDDEDDSERVSVDEDGQEIPKESKEWFTGR